MSALWYANRAFGLVSLVLLTSVLVLGLQVAARRPGRPRRSYVVTAVHRSVSLLSVVFVGIHAAAAVLDGYVPIGWLDMVLPFGAAYRPMWLGLGAVALDLMIALIVTSLLRARLGLRTWRAVHWLAYVCWPIALVHGIAMGSDTPAVTIVAVVGALAVVAAGTYRLRVRTPLPATGGTR